MGKPKPVEERKNGKAMTPTNPRASGRPTVYDPTMPEQLIEHMRQGYSKTAAAFLMGISTRHLIDWAKKYPEMADALEFGQGARTHFHETRLMTAIEGPQVTSAIFALKNAAPHEFRDRHEITGADGGAIQVEHNMAPLEIARRMALLLAQGQQILAAAPVIEHEPQQALEEPDAAWGQAGAFSP